MRAPHVYDETADEEEAEPRNGRCDESEIRLSHPEVGVGVEAVNDVQTLEDGDGEVEADSGDDESYREQCRWDLPDARPELQHRPSLQEERCLDKNRDRDADAIGSHLDVVVDLRNKLDIAGHDSVQLQPAGRVEEGKQEGADHVECECGDVYDGRCSFEAGFGRHDQEDYQHDEAGSNLASIIDSLRRHGLPERVDCVNRNGDVVLARRSQQDHGLLVRRKKNRRTVGFVGRHDG